MLLARGMAAGDDAPGHPVDPLSGALLAMMPPTDAAALTYAAPAAEPGGDRLPADGLNALVSECSSLYHRVLFATAT